MKLLIIFLISFNVQAAIKLTLEKGGQPWGGQPIFDTAQEAQDFLDKNKNNKAWGKLDRWAERQLEETCGGLPERQVGDIVTGFKYECFHLATFTICGKHPDQVDIAVDCEDVSVQIEIENNKRDACQVLEVKLKSPADLTLVEMNSYLRCK